MVETLIIAIGIQVVFVVVAILLDKTTSLLVNILGTITSKKAVNIVYNIVTFIGVVHHEISHALIAKISGAKVTGINLYKVDLSRGTLGSIGFRARGPKLLKDIQRSLTAMAPIITAPITMYFMYHYGVVGCENIWILSFMYYSMLSIALHMTLSKEDWYIYRKGCIGTTLILWIILYFVIKG